jgi:hypothetical protein
MTTVLTFFVLIWGITVSSHAAEPGHRHETGRVCGSPASAGAPPVESLQGIQIETSAIADYEALFESILRAAVVFKVDHPQVDHLRGYCYRDVLIVIRQDLKTPRPTGWVQVNFSVSDVQAVRSGFEEVLQAAGTDKARTAKLKFKADVPRSNCRVARLEVFGPEGFLLGFDQIKPETCQVQQSQKEMTP